MEGTGKQAFQKQAENIIANIKKDLQNSKDPLNFKTICPNFLQIDIFKVIRNGLEPSELTQTEFLFD